MFKNKALSCMLALGLTVAAAPAVLAGPNDTAGNTGVVDKTENPEDAPTQPPGEESSGATSTEGTSTEGSTEGTTTPESTTEGTTSSGSSLPQTGAPVVLLAPVLAAGGVAGYSLYKKSH